MALVGEPGIGKTRLLRELKLRARKLGFRVLDGRAFELEQDIPFGLVAETLDKPLSELEPALLAQLGEERVEELAAVLPSLTSAGRGLTSMLDAERYRSHHAVRAALEQLATERPLLLAFDDVHWADPASLEVVSHLLRRGMPRSLLALAYRPRQAPRGLADTVARQLRETGLCVLELEPLSQPEAAKLIDDLAPASFEALYADSGGNPFYLEQLARASDGTTERADGGRARPDRHGAVPTAVREAIANELGTLSAGGLQLLQAAAAAGEPFDLDLAAKVAAMEEPAAFTALDELVDAELLHETDVPGSLMFRHPIVRRAVYDATGSGWLLAAHRRAASVLDDRGGAIGTRAYHVERSAEVGNQEAIALLTQAGQAAMARAPAAAARWLEAALRLLPETADAERQLTLLLPLAAALGNIGRLQDCQAMLIRALALVPESDVAVRGGLTASIARTKMGLGRGNEARRLLQTALAKTEPGSAEAIGLTVELATCHLALREWEDAAEAAATARDRARAVGAPSLIAAAAAVGAVIEAFRGATTLTRSRLLTDEATAALDALADDDFDSVAFGALVNTAYSEVSRDRWETAIRHAERGIRIGRALGHGALVVDFMNIYAVARLQQGQLEQARQGADTAIEGAMLVDGDQRLALAEAIRCYAASAQGEHDEALASGRRSIEAAERTPSALHAWIPPLAYGQALVAAGKRVAGRNAILAAGGYELADVPPNFRARQYRLLAEFALADGDLELAERMTRRAEDSAETMDLSFRRADARYARACMHRACGHLALAIEALRDAIAHYEAAGNGYDLILARIFAGDLLAEAGDVAAAQRELELARAAGERIGAEAARRQAAEGLRRLGMPVKDRPRRRRPPAHGLDALTAREREVADLVVQGHTNREIAEQLFVSPKTVETHLSQVFAKLGVSSRIAVAAAIQAAVTSS